MLALNAPPAQGPVMNPFVHYRCRCCSPGPVKAETSAEAASEQQTESGQEDRPTTTSLALVPPTTGTHPSAEAHESARSTKEKEFFDSGNTSDTHGSQSLSRLYFCDSCDEIRCSKCTQDEIVCYYCPNCLFDVPTASVKMEKHK